MVIPCPRRRCVRGCPMVDGRHDPGGKLMAAATLIGGNGTGTLDSSLYLLNRNDTTGAGSAGNNEQIYINVSNGNLVLGHNDEYLPSETNDFLTFRTYN